MKHMNGETLRTAQSVVQRKSDLFSRRTVAIAFGKALREQRCTAAMSQEVLAELAAINRGYPSTLERGLRHPTLDVILRISSALNVEPATLIELTLAKLTGSNKSDY